MSGFPVPTRRGRPPGARSRDKGNRVERIIARLLTANGFAARKVSGMYRPSIRVRLLGVDHAVEVKCRGDGFRQLYDWLRDRDVLIVKADRQEPLVVLRMSLAAEIAKGSDVTRNFLAKGNIAGRAAA
jgi:hypothetical protein